METNYEDDDDTHYCIKCHLTVNGLDNYVRHRQTECRPSERKNAVTPDPPTPTVSYPEILNADAFFSSLELQSSAKTKSTLVRTGNEEKKLERRGDRRKRTRRYQEIDVPSPKEKLLTLAPVVTDLDDPTDHIGIPSLVGFPDIDPFTDKASTSTKIHTSIVSKPSDSDKKQINDHHRVWSDDDSVDIDETKETDIADELDIDTQFDYQHDDDTNDSQCDDIDQVDLYSETDEAEDAEYTPQTHTGGKWKPGQLLHHITRQNDDLVDHDEDRDNLAPTHTGGKWKPEKIEEDEPEDDYKDHEVRDSAIIRNSSTRQPPPGHTHGKWIPGATTTIPSEHGYWCSPCGRKLTSKLVYNRHLRSDLHARRSIQEIEGDVKLPRSVGPLLREKCRTKRQRTLAMKQTEAKKTITDVKPTKKTRHREKEFVRCEMCHARVRRSQLGKHLLSHYHCRVAGLNPSSTAAQRFILENMANVVRQCPFQCSSCRFYCNTEDTFLLHWRSNLHSQTPNDDESNYICMCCDVWCDDNATMEKHLLSLEHRETVAMINGSVPIVVRRQRFLICQSCNRRFRYNFQLRLHAKDSGHPINYTASDEYQKKNYCDLCPQVLKSQLALQRHQLTCHNKFKEPKEKIPMPYFCSFCSINFETAHDAVLHRRTASHKQIVKDRKFGSIEGDSESSSQRDCDHCGEKQNNLSEYKQHLLQCHSDRCHKCNGCGEVFALFQDMTRHINMAECTRKLLTTNHKYVCSEDKSECTKCSFITNSHSEFIFHQAIHKGAIEIDPKQASLTSTNAATMKSSIKYRCPICDKIYTKGSLHNHIRRHTGEKLFSCPSCDKSFTKKSNMTEHANKCSSTSALPSSESHDNNNADEKKERQRNYTCLECNTAFYTKDNLRQHMFRHTGKNYKCGLPGCPTVLRTEAELKVHRALIHENTTDIRKYHCDVCSYAAKTKTQLRRHQTRHMIPTGESQFSCSHKGCNFSTRFKTHLKRHMHIHTGVKPYQCPHCTYASNNIENLRKHVISTTLHPGKTIYQCDKCKDYGTNFAKQLRAHLIETHAEEFPTSVAVNSYVAGIFGT